MRRLSIALAQYPLDWLDDYSAYEAKLERWVSEAASTGNRLLVFPEYAGIELASLAGRAAAADLARSIETVSDVLPEADALHQHLAQRHAVYILAGSAPRRRPDGAVRNVARLFAPNGSAGRQEKIMMTRFERERWGITGGHELTVFDIGAARIGIAICYDVEFPLISRALVEAGAELILAPSCTDTVHGYWRVRIGAQARALENQCLTAQASLVGEVDWSPAVDINRGAAGVYGPPDLGFPENGVLAEGEMDRARWVEAEIDLDAIAQVREEGQVFNHRNWPEQRGFDAVRRVELREGHKAAAALQPSTR